MSCPSPYLSFTEEYAFISATRFARESVPSAVERQLIL
jgi:hypothetical protein